MDKIARIRREIERQKEINKKLLDGQLKAGCLYALNQVLSFLKTLSEEPDTPEFPETFEICLYDGRTPNKENCNECSTTCSVRKEEPDKSLEEAAKQFVGYDMDTDDLRDYEVGIQDFIAGAQWRDAQIPKLPNDVDDAAEAYRRESYKKATLPNIDGPIPEYGGSIKDAFIAGAEWQKEQMLKDAYVESQIVEDGRIELGGDPLPCLDPIILLPWPQFKPDDKVRIVVLKEEE